MSSFGEMTVAATPNEHFLKHQVEEYLNLKCEEEVSRIISKRDGILKLFNEEASNAKSELSARLSEAAGSASMVC